MPQPYKGRRQALTVRLPLDLYIEATRRAKRRQWSVSHYVAWCIAREHEIGAKAGRNEVPARALSQNVADDR